MSTVTEPAPADVPAEPVAVVGEATAGQPLVRRGRRSVTIAFYLATILLLLTFNFVIPRLMPGDPIDALLSFGSPNYVTNDATRAELAEYYDLDRSFPEQYLDYMAGLVRGDLGVSIVSNAPVADELVGRAGWSLLLVTAALLVSVVIGLPAGIHSGWKRGRSVDRGLLAFFLSVQNLPIFFVGLVVLVVFSAQLGIFPLGGAMTPFSEYTGFRHVIDIAHHLALPALLMGLDFATYEYLVMRSSMVSELGADYLVGGRAKGLREQRLKYRYAGRNALVPVVTVIGLQFSMAVTGLIFVERIFSYPGIGGYLFDAVATRDYPAMQGAFLVLTLSVVTANLVVDLLYRRLDPRVST